jgi:hypothetical protein
MELFVVLHCGCVIDVTNCNVQAIEGTWCGFVGEGRLCFGSAGIYESGYTLKCSLCLVGFVTEGGIVCYICIVEDKEQCVSCIAEVNKLKSSLKFYHMCILNLQVYMDLHFVLLVMNSIG